jgi:hypothetical protein
MLHQFIEGASDVLAPMIEGAGANGEREALFTTLMQAVAYGPLSR